MFTRDSQPGLRMLILVVLSVALMIFDTRVAAISHVRNTLTMALTPLQYLVSEPILLIDDARRSMNSRLVLLRENADLKSQQLLLKAQVQRLLAIESENSQLKALLRTSAQVQGKVLIAQLLAVNIDPFVHHIILDRGGRDGVFLGQPVLDADGVMGQVVQLGPLTSRVLLINDPRSGVPVQVTRNGVRAIAVGDNFTGKLKLVNIPQTIDIKEGDVLTTSGLGDYFPEGYPLGTVTSVVKDPAMQFATIQVEPSAHLDRAREVLLVWPSKAVQEKKLALHKIMQLGASKTNV